MYRFVYIIFLGNEIGFILISSRKQPLENGTWLFNLDGILFGFPVVLSSLSAFSKETVWAITILLISQRLIRHSYGGEEWLHSGTHFITITCFTHLELIFPWGARDSNSKASHNCKWKRKKQLFNRAADNDIFKENIQQRHASFSWIVKHKVIAGDGYIINHQRVNFKRLYSLVAMNWLKIPKTFTSEDNFDSSR